MKISMPTLSHKMPLTLTCCLSLLWWSTASAFAETIAAAKSVTASATATPAMTPTPGTSESKIPEDPVVKLMRENIEKHIMQASEYSKSLGLPGVSPELIERINTNPLIKSQYETALKKLADFYKKNTGSDEFKKLEAKENAGETLTAAEQKRLRDMRMKMMPKGYIAEGNIGPTGKFVSDNSYGPMKELNDRSKKTASNLEKIGKDADKSKNRGYFVQNQTIAYNPDFIENDDSFSKSYRKNFLNTTATASALSENENICTPNGTGTDSYYQLITAARKYENKQAGINREHEANIEKIRADYTARRAAIIDKTTHDSNATLLNEQEQRDTLAEKADMAEKSSQAQEELAQDAAGAGDSAGGEGQSNMGLMMAAMAIIMIALILMAMIAFGCVICLIIGIALLIIGLIMLLIAMLMQNKMGTQGGGGPQPAKGSSMPAAAAAAAAKYAPTPTPTPSATPSLTPAPTQDSYTSMAKQENQVLASYSNAQKRKSSVASLDFTPYEGKNMVGKKALDGSIDGESKVYDGTARSLDSVNYHRAAYNNAVSQLECNCPEPETRKQYAMEVSALAARTAKESAQAALMLRKQSQQLGTISATIEKDLPGDDGMNLKEKMKFGITIETGIQLPGAVSESSTTNTLSISGKSGAQRKAFAAEKTTTSVSNKSDTLKRFSGVTASAVKQTASKNQGQQATTPFSTTAKSAVAIKDQTSTVALTNNAGEINVAAVEAQLGSMKANLGKLQGTGTAVTLVTTETSVTNVGAPDATGTSVSLTEGIAVEQVDQNAPENVNTQEAIIAPIPQNQLLDPALDIFNAISHRYRSTAFPLLLEPAASSI